MKQGKVKKRSSTRYGKVVIQEKSISKFLYKKIWRVFQTEMEDEQWK